MCIVTLFCAEPARPDEADSVVNVAIPHVNRVRGAVVLREAATERFEQQIRSGRRIVSECTSRYDHLRASRVACVNASAPTGPGFGTVALVNQTRCGEVDSQRESPVPRLMLQAVFVLRCS